MTYETCKLEKRIQELEQVLKEWHALSRDILPSFSKDKVLEKTRKVLRESERSGENHARQSIPKDYR